MSNAQKNIYDIASKAGVSIATVSRVLAGKTGVRESTREKVLAVVASAGYQPNAFARGLGLGSMKLVAVLCTEVSDLYYADAVDALERLLRARGYEVMLACAGDSLPEKKAALERVAAKGVDAVILVGSVFKEAGNNAHIEAVAARLLVIIINGLVDCEGVYCVLCDERAAMRDNVAALGRRGCKRPLYLHGADTYSGTQKLSGYREGLHSIGEPVDDALIVQCERSCEAAKAAVLAVMAAETTFDGVLASEDILAIGACKALATHGKTPPVIGFNNSVLARCATPELSSVDNMARQLCRIAVQHLDSLLHNGEPPPKKTIVSAALVLRET